MSNPPPNATPFIVMYHGRLIIELRPLVPCADTCNRYFCRYNGIVLDIIENGKTGLPVKIKFFISQGEKTTIAGTAKYSNDFNMLCFSDIASGNRPVTRSWLIVVY